MQNTKAVNGFNLIELIVVISIISVLIVIAGQISNKYFKRRAIDLVSNKIVSQLNFTKLYALTRGIESQLVINFNPNDNLITMNIEEGDSNTGSTIYKSINKSDSKISLIDGYEIMPNSITFNFNPNGTLGGRSGSIRIKPINEDRAKGLGIKKCASIVVSPFGRIRSVVGKWDFNTKTVSRACKGFGDKQEKVN